MLKWDWFINKEYLGEPKQARDEGDKQRKFQDSNSLFGLKTQARNELMSLKCFWEQILLCHVATYMNEK